MLIDQPERFDQVLGMPAADGLDGFSYRMMCHPIGSPHCGTRRAQIRGVTGFS